MLINKYVKHSIVLKVKFVSLRTKIEIAQFINCIPIFCFTKCVKKQAIAVVGGGVGGLSTAWHLAKTGRYNVKLFERETVGAFSQASSINSAFLYVEPLSNERLASSSLDSANVKTSRTASTLYLLYTIL